MTQSRDKMGAMSPNADALGIIECMNESVIVRDLAGLAIGWNENSMELYGWTRDEILGRDPDELLSSSPRFLPPWSSSSVKWSSDIVRSAADGRPVHVSSRFTVCVGQDRKPIYLVEASLEVPAPRGASHPPELPPSFVHDVGQPLTAITVDGETGLRWLRREIPDTERVAACLSRILSNARRISEVIGRAGDTGARGTHIRK